MEKVDDFFLRGVICVAFGVKGADAGAVLAPLVLPEAFVVAVHVFPVGVHVGQEIGLARRLQDLRDVCVCATGVAVGVIGPVAVIGPEPVDGP